MRVLKICLTFVAGVAAVLITAGDARTETFNLEMKRLPASYQAMRSSEPRVLLRLTAATSRGLMSPLTSTGQRWSTRST